MRSLKMLVKKSQLIKRGGLSYIRLADLKRNLINEPSMYLTFDEDICLSLFYLTHSMTYEFYEYEFLLIRKDDNFSSCSLLINNQQSNASLKLKAIREFTPVYIEINEHAYNKECILNWIDFALKDKFIIAEVDHLGVSYKSTNLYVTYC